MYGDHACSFIRWSSTIPTSQATDRTCRNLSPRLYSPPDVPYKPAMIPAPSVETRSQKDLAIEVERIRFTLDIRRSARALMLVAYLCVCAVLWTQYPAWVPLTWLGSGIALVAYRGARMRAWQRLGISIETIPFWRRTIVTTMVIFGCHWGIASALLVWSGDAVSLGTVGMVMTATILGGLGAASAPPAFSVFAILAFVPGIVILLGQMDRAHFVLAVVAVGTLYSLLRLGRQLSGMIEETLRLRQDKDEALERLSQQTAIAQANAAEKTRFLAAASHDLRQPLQALSLFSAALDPRIVGADDRQLWDRMNQSLDALTGLFDNLLDVARLDLGQIPMAHEAVSLPELFEELQMQFEPLALAKGLELRAHALPAAVNSNPVQLQRLLTNLLTNAIRYTGQGRILLAARRAGADIRIEVRDGGCGIAQAEHEAIFREFYQIGNPERDRRKGVGLGLSTVQRIARLLGHAITVRSRPDRGSVFAITLTRASTPRHEAAVEAPAIPANALLGVSVLVIDDESEIRVATAAALTGWGCEVWCADGPAAAHELIEQHGRPPQLVLCDYRLRSPETGVQIVATLRQRWSKNLPAVIVSGDSGAQALDEARAAGLSFHRKPARPAALRALLNSLVRNA